MIRPFLFLFTSVALVAAVTPQDFDGHLAQPSEETLREVNQFIAEINRALVAKETDEAMLNVQHQERANVTAPISISPKCKSCTQFPPQTEEPSVSVYISFSVPTATWKEYSDVLVPTGGVFVLKGLPENSFATFVKRVRELRTLGIDAPIRLDPEAFAKYDIQAVPALILEEEDRYDKVTGNQRIEESLRMIQEKGTAHQSAERLLSQLRRV